MFLHRCDFLCPAHRFGHLYLIKSLSVWANCTTLRVYLIFYPLNTPLWADSLLILKYEMFFVGFFAAMFRLRWSLTNRLPPELLYHTVCVIFFFHLSESLPVGSIKRWRGEPVKFFWLRQLTLSCQAGRLGCCGLWAMNQLVGVLLKRVWSGCDHVPEWLFNMHFVKKRLKKFQRRT